MTGRDERRIGEVATEKIEPPETHPPTTPEKPARALPATYVIANTFLAGATYALAGVLTRYFWPSLTTVGVIVIAAAIPGGGFGLLKWLYGKQLEDHYRQVMERRSTTGTVFVVLGCVLWAALVLTEARSERVIRIVPGSSLYEELGFLDQTLEIVVDGCRFTFTSPQQTVFYICGGREHLNAALAKERKGRPEALATLVETIYGLVGPDDGATRTAILQKWTDEFSLQRRWPFTDKRAAPTATFFAPATTTPWTLGARVDARWSAEGRADPPLSCARGPEPAPQK